MRKMKFFALLMIFGFGATANAALDYALEAGVRQQSGDFEGGGIEGKVNFQMGASGYLNIFGPWNLRTGLFYTQRNMTLKIGNVKADLDMSTVDIPLTIMYKFEDYAGIFLGVNLVTKLDTSISGGGVLTDEKSLYTPLVLGATFKFAPQLGASVYFETASGKVAEGLDNLRAIGANLIVTFD